MFIYILLAFVIIVIAILVSGYLLKKRHYQQINELETKKITLYDRPVIDELGKVKKLKLTGQTEELFESWRESWDEIASKLFPDLEETFMEAEMHVDKYQFRAATNVENDIEQMLAVIEKQMDSILAGLHELLQSEEKNAEESRTTKEKFAGLRREVLTRGFKLGNTRAEIEQKLDQLALELNEYDHLTDQGDHLEAREKVKHVQVELQQVEVEMEKIPNLLHETEVALPDDIGKLNEGHEEMVRDGFYLAHLEIPSETSRMREQLEKLRTTIQDLNLEAAEEGVVALHKELDLFYDELEKEVTAKRFVKDNRSVIGEKITNLIQAADSVAVQIEEVKQTYHVGEDELATYLKTSEKLEKQSESYEQVITLLQSNEIAFSAAQDTFKEIEIALNEITLEQDEFTGELRSLRKDELEARDAASAMRRTVIGLDRKIERERLPGLPEDYVQWRLHLGESIDNLEAALEAKPLNMKTVSQHWQVAEEDLRHLTEKTEEMIENVQLVEHVIQYANRYRLSNPELAESLSGAEYHFYEDFQYKKALEIAVTALEKVESGAFKKIEKKYTEQDN